MDFPVLLAQASTSSFGSTIVSIFTSLAGIACFFGAIRAFGHWRKGQPLDVYDKISLAVFIPVVIVVVIFFILLKAQGSSTRQTSGTRPTTTTTKPSNPNTFTPKAPIQRPAQPIVRAPVQPTMRVCSTCTGKGKVEESKSWGCSPCEGTGKIAHKSHAVSDHTADAFGLYKYVTCNTCKGTGKTLHKKQVKCKICNGVGKIA